MHISKVGNRYGRLTVLEIDKKRGGGKQGYYYICKCDCGTVKSIRGNVLGKTTKSCGCLAKELAKKTLKRYTSGESHSRLACIWYHMRSRCNNPKDTNYKRYGARGIRVCQEWEKDFLIFKKWALNSGYKSGLTIERIDFNGNYEPSNCKWATLSEQQRNKRTNIFIFHKGKYKCLMEAYLEEKPPITYQTVRERYHKGVNNLEKLFKK